MITLRPMLPDELAAWHAKHVEAYVADRVGAGDTPEEARRVIDEQHAAYFPGGRPASGHEVLMAELDGEPIGIAWWGPHPRRPDDPTAAFIYDIEVDEAHRGQGHGRGLLAAIEERVRGAGATTLTLNVFGDNATARRLYTSAGYREVSLIMTKPLDG